MAVDAAKATNPQPPSARSWKVYDALDVLVARHATTWRPDVRLGLGGDDIPRGVGMGSSTADVAVAAAAAADLFGVEDPASLAVDIALAIEPTNGSVLGGLTLFDHREGRVRDLIGLPPAASIVVVRRPGAVDTIDFNGRLPRRVSAPLIRAWAEVFRLCRAGVDRQDLEMVGAAASRSAELAVHLGAEPLSPMVIDVVQETGAVGLIRAHSGTVLGFLYPLGAAPDPMEIVDRIAKHTAVLHAAAHMLTEGGVRCEGRLRIQEDEVIVRPHREGVHGSPV